MGTGTYFQNKSNIKKPVKPGLQVTSFIQKICINKIIQPEVLQHKPQSHAKVK